jgi:hypothetical protein
MQLWLNKPVRSNQCSSSLYAICVGGLGADGVLCLALDYLSSWPSLALGSLGTPLTLGLGEWAMSI